MMWNRIAGLWLVASLMLLGCDGDHDHGQGHEHDDHAHDDHAHDDHPHDDHAHDDHAHDDHAHDDHAHDDHPHDDHPHDDHSHDDHPHDDHPHDDHDDHDAAEVVTLWGEATQLFVEFPALVVGEDSSFAAHLTRLSDHLPLDTGTVVVELTGGGSPAERFSVNAPSRAGIFRPVVTPGHPGVRHVMLRLDSPQASEVHDMGEFRVFESRQAANRAARRQPPEAVDEIAFLLEQQWPIPFGIARVTERTIRPNISAFAQFSLPNGAQTVAVAPTAGRLVDPNQSFPQVGDVVELGDALFAVNVVAQGATDPAALDLAVSEAAIRTAQAQQALDRLRPLAAQGVVAQRRVDEAELDLAAAQAASRAARRQRDNRQRNQELEGGRDTLEVRSPIRGVVAEVHAAPGAWVSESQPVIRIVDPSRLWLDVHVPESYAPRIEHVSGVWFESGAAGEVVELGPDALVSVALEIEPTTRTLLTRFDVDNTDRRFVAGASVQARLVTATPNRVPAVPMLAVVDDSGTDVVYVQTGGERFVRRPVRLGSRDGAYVAVEGVEAGEWIATVGAYSVKLASTSTESVGHGHAH